MIKKIGHDLNRTLMPVSSGETSQKDTPPDPLSILTAIGEVVYTWDLGCDGLTWGANAIDVLGQEMLERVGTGRGYAGFVEPGSGRSPHAIIFDNPGRDQGTGVAYRTRYLLRATQADVLSVEDSGRWFAGLEGQPAMAHGVLRIERLSDMAREKNAHGLSDRAAFLRKLSEEMEDAVRSNRAIAVLVMSISDLNGLNDALGEEGGDEIIQAVTTRMAGTMRRRDYLGRYAGNRHAAILMSCSSGQIEAAAERFAGAVSRKAITTSRGSAAARIRIGGAVSPDHATDAATLLRCAETALSALKGNPREMFALYRPNEDRDLAQHARAMASHDVVEALNDRRLLSAHQPVVDARTRHVAFKETLLRLRKVDGSVVGASEIVPVVEQLGLVRLVDHRILELAVDHLARTKDARLSINVSSLALADSEWLDGLAAHLGTHRGVAERLIIEVKETAAIEDPRAMSSRLDCMKALGVSIGIAAFGAGHTSFRHLRSFPVDIIKIDGAFVQNLSRSTDDRFFMRTVIDLAQHLGIATVAEWVEDEQAACQLAEWGVDYLQGDHIGRPALVEPYDEAASGRSQGEAVLEAQVA